MINSTTFASGWAVRRRSSPKGLGNSAFQAAMHSTCWDSYAVNPCGSLDALDILAFDGRNPIRAALGSFVLNQGEQYTMQIQDHQQITSLSIVEISQKS